MTVSPNRRSVMTLYSDPRQITSHRIRMVLAEKGITVEIIDANANDPKDEVHEYNPYGNLPTLVDRDLMLYESHIINEYLDERFPHPPLLQVDPVLRANARLYIYRIDQDWVAPMQAIADGAENSEQLRKQLRESLISAAPIFAAHPYFMSEELTLVDCNIAPLLWRLPMVGVKLPTQAKPILEYAARIFKRKSFQESLTELEKEMRS